MPEDPGSNQVPHTHTEAADSADSGGLAMMLMMMACCLGFLLIFAIIPFVGLPIGLAIGGVGLVAMFYGHQKMMGGHSGHH